VDKHAPQFFRKTSLQANTEKRAESFLVFDDDGESFALFPLASSAFILLGVYLPHTFFCFAEPETRRATSTALQS
jgi:hypothetical protein